MKYLVFFLSFLGCIQVHAQHDLKDKSFFMVDSLDYDGLDSSEISLITNYIEQFHEVEHDTLKLELLEDLFDNLWNESAGKKYVLLMLKMAQEGQLDSKNEREEKTFKFYEAVSYGNLGYLYDVHEELDLAKNVYEKALPLFRETGKKAYESHIVCALGLIAEYKGNTRKAMDLYQEAILLAKEAGDTNRIIYPNSFLADMHSNFKNYNAAKKAHEENLFLAENIKDTSQMANELNSLATVTFFLKDTIKAFNYLNRAIPLSKQAGNVHLYMLLKKSYGNFLYEVGKLDSAKIWLESTREYFESNNYPREISSLYNHFGNIAEQEGKLREAEQQYSKALEIARKERLLEMEVTVLNHLSKVNFQLGRHELAFNQLQDFVVNRDSLRNAKYKTELLEQAIGYEYEKEKELQAKQFESEMAIADERSKTQQILIVLSVLIGLIVLVAFIYSSSQFKTIKKQAEALNIAYEELEIRKNDEVLASNLKAIQSQMNPHFIFNALNSIQTFVLKGEVDNSYTYINRFADLIRTTLSFSDLELVSFKEEIELLDNYLSLEKLRFREDFDYQITTNTIPELSIPPLLLQPLIENALIHGLLHKPTGRYLELSFNFKNDQLSCEITDNGIGREAAKAINLRKNKKHKSFATKALKRRFEYLSRRFNKEFDFQYIDLFEDGEATGTKVVVSLPFLLNDKG